MRGYEALSFCEHFPNADQLFEGDRALIDGIRDVVPAILRANQTPGMSLALARYNRPVWEASFGFCDVESACPMTNQSTFRIGSLGKVFVAISTLQLVEQGVVSLDGSLSDFMPFPVVNPISRSHVTVRQVMSHLSGLAGWDTGGVRAQPELDSVSALRDMLGEERTGQYGGDYSAVWVSEPGQSPSYSNLGVSLLALMIEHTNPDGLQYEDFVQRYLFDPLEMKSSLCLRAPSAATIREYSLSPLAEGYMMLGGARMRSPELFYDCFAGQGALSRPGDFIHVVSMLLKGGVFNGKRVLQASSVKEMLSPQHSECMPLTGALPGLVLMLNRWEQARRSFSHAGSYAWGWRSAAYAWPEHGTALVISANQISVPRVSSDIHQVLRFVEDWLLTEPPTVEASESAIDWSWKLSYCRGLLMVEATYGWLGVCQRPSEVELEAWASAIEKASESPRNWSRSGFLQGARDLLAEPLDREGFREFLSSTRVKVNQQEVEQALYELGSSPDLCIYPTLLHSSTAAARESW